MKKQILSAILIIAIVIGFSSCSKSVDNPNIITPTYFVGEYYGGGIVFYVDATGQHGLISSTQDQSNACTWCPTNISIIPHLYLNKEIGNGLSNTISIENTFGAYYYAATYCTSYSGGGYNDWYLPSLNELDLMYKNKITIGGFGFVNPSNYWSSTTSTTGTVAFTEDFSTGTQFGHDPLRNNVSVRAIRSF